MASVGLTVKSLELLSNWVAVVCALLLSTSSPRLLKETICGSEPDRYLISWLPSGAVIVRPITDLLPSSKVFNASIDKINDATNPEVLEEWDSFNFYVLLDEIEKSFGITFDLDETLEIKKIGDFKQIFDKHGIKL